MYNHCWKNPHPDIKVEDDKIWPKVCSSSVKHDTEIVNVTIVENPNGETTLDCIQYPELGKKSFPKKYLQQNEEIGTIETEDGGCAAKKYNSMMRITRKPKRNDLIFINLREILENGKLQRKSQSDVPAKFICDYAIDFKPSIPRHHLGNDLSERRNKIHFVKFKRPTKLKKIIFLERAFKKQIQCGGSRSGGIKGADLANQNAILALSQLKLETNPILDKDYVRGLATMSLFDMDYRDASTSDTVEISNLRFDIVSQLKNLQMKQEENADVGSTSMMNMDSDILEKTVALTICDKSSDTETTSDNVQVQPQYSKKFRE